MHKTTKREQPNCNYLTHKTLKEYYIPETEDRLVEYLDKLELLDIANDGFNGIEIEGMIVKINDYVSLEWSNGVNEIGLVVEFGCTFDGRVFPIVQRCNDDLTPKKRKNIISGTWLGKEYLTIKKYEI